MGECAAVRLLGDMIVLLCYILGPDPVFIS